MKPKPAPRLWLPVLLVLAAELAAADGGFTPLFNGQDLTGWVPVNVAPSTFTVRDGVIVSTGVPTGILRTERMYENFVLELEYRHLKAGGNAGLFVWSDALTAPGVPFSRSTEIQILDGQETAHYTSHGDVFPIHGASFTPDRPHPAGWMRCLPSERRARPAPEWNHYRVTCRDGRVSLAVNGQDVSGGYGTRPRKGYLCLEAEGSECHFRNLRIRELPSSNPGLDEVAQAESGFVSLYTGVDLAGWTAGSARPQQWMPRDWVLACGGARASGESELWTEKSFGDFVLICDWRWAGQATNEPAGQAGESGVCLRGSTACRVSITRPPSGSGGVFSDPPGRRPDSERPSVVTPSKVMDRPRGEWNRFVITVKAGRVRVGLNGATVAEDVPLPGIPGRGPIGLRHPGAPLEFANLYVKEL